jgi:hypothetical protein
VERKSPFSQAWQRERRLLSRSSPHEHPCSKTMQASQAEEGASSRLTSCDAPATCTPASSAPDCPARWMWTWWVRVVEPLRRRVAYFVWRITNEIH